MARSSKYGVMVAALAGQLRHFQAGLRARAVAAGPDPLGRTWYKIDNKGDTGPATLHIYDEIGYWGVSADAFMEDLTAIGGRDLVLRINSPGGEVFDGVAIYNALSRHAGTITAHVDGLAASAASFIAMSADELVMEPGAQMMIHDAIGACWGNESEMRKMTEMLGRTSDTIAAIYAERAGGEPAEWRAIMKDERWYNGAEAVEAKLADRVGDGRTREVADVEDDATKTTRADEIEDKAAVQRIAATVAELRRTIADGRARVAPSSRPAAVRQRALAPWSAGWVANDWDESSVRRDGEGKFAKSASGFMSIDTYADSYDVHDEYATSSGLTVAVMTNGADYQFAWDDADLPDHRAVFADMEREQLEHFRDQLGVASRDGNEGAVYAVGDEDDPLFEIHSDGVGGVVLYPTATGDDGAAEEFALDLPAAEVDELDAVIADVLAVEVPEIEMSAATAWLPVDWADALSTNDPVSSTEDDHVAPWEAWI
jgi:ATP-dependent protease ClpP protease subunit